MKSFYRLLPLLIPCTLAILAIRAAEVTPIHSAPLEPAPLTIQGAPDPRKLAEVTAILGDSLTAPSETSAKPLRVVLCASEKDKHHLRPGSHDYPLWRERWTQLLGMAPGLTVEPAEDWPDQRQWDEADVIVINSHNPAWSAESDPAKLAALGKQMDTYLARGGGLVFIHYAINGGPNAALLAERIGGAVSNKNPRYRHGASDWILDKDHPLAAGFRDWHHPDESYWNLTGDLSGSAILASSVEEENPEPQMWTREQREGRVFVSIPGHFTWTYDDPLYRILVFRGIMWSARQPLDRLAPLVTVGARVVE